MTAHNYSTTYTVDKEAVCLTDGSKSRHCTTAGCTAKTDVTTISSEKNHEYGSKQYVYYMGTFSNQYVGGFYADVYELCKCNLKHDNKVETIGLISSSTELYSIVESEYPGAQRLN